MDATLSTEALQRELLAVVPGAERKEAVLQILNNIRIDADGDTVRLATTTLYKSAQSELEATVSAAGSTTVHAQRLASLVRRLTARDVRIVVEGDSLLVKSGKASLKLPTLDADKFPALSDPSGKKIKVSIDKLTTAINQARYAVAPEGARDDLQAMQVTCNAGRISVAGVDGHRLSEAAFVEQEATTDWSCMIPRTNLDLLLRFLSDAKSAVKGSEEPEAEAKVLAFVNDKHVFFCHGTRTIAIVQAPEQLPPYAKMIPKGQARRIRVNRSEMLGALSLLVTLSEEKANSMEFLLVGDELTIEAKDASKGEGRSSIVVEHEFKPDDGDEYRITLNGGYVAQLFESMPTKEVDILLGNTPLVAPLAFPVYPPLPKEEGEEHDGEGAKLDDRPSLTGLIMPLRG